MTADDRVARSRFFIIGLVRLAGALMIALAVAITYGRVTAVPGEFGYVLLAAGVMAMVILPQMLVARWKSPPPEE
ncbi:hypothetical protein [Blastomonas sp. AAP53]|uniref:hypothetical protein n=1 Tax=Blastomonas sp. AAP53 TaxID=1248760 RepID=UPI0002F38CF4|nr:hypothetical protein [Blastomonas sp. AAP53]